MSSERAGMVVSVGGGRGAGKSVVAASLAVALAEAGGRVVLVDAGDAGAQRALFGLAWLGAEAPHGAPPDLVATAVESGVPGLRLAASAGPRLLRQVRALDADVVVVDVGAQAGREAQEAFDAADHRLVVLTPGLAAAQETYAFVMGAVLRELWRVAAAAGREGLVDEAAERAERAGPAFSAAQLLSRLAREDEALAAALQAALSGFGVRLVANQVYEARDTNLVYALSRMTRDFLGVEAPVLGALRDSQRLHASATDGRPYLVQAGVEGDECAVTFHTMAQALRTAPLRRTPGARAGDRPAAAAPARDWALPAALPVDVGDYERSYQRHLVDVPGTLVYPGGILAAQFKDVSEGGALLELDRPPPAGTRITLVVPALGDHPGLACVVRHADAR